MKIAILDDELHCIESLISDIQRLFPQLQIVYKSAKPLEAVEALKGMDIDLLFLDVEMPLMNGFDFLNQFEKLPFDVIFTTAYSQYAIKAFDVQAIDYLLKPIDEDELKETLDRYIVNRDMLDNPSTDVTQLLEFLRKEGILKNKLAIPTAEGLEFIEITNIIYCRSENNETKIYTCDKRVISILRPLEGLENSLNKFMFIRVHESYLVNPNYMQKYIRNDGGYLTLVNGDRVPVSQSKQKTIMEIFERLQSN